MANSARVLVSLRLKKNTLCGRGLNYYSTATGFTKLDDFEFIVCNRVTRRSYWWSGQQEAFSKNLHENERGGFLLDNQYCRRDVTCKPAIASNTIYFPPLCSSRKYPYPPPPPTSPTPRRATEFRGEKGPKRGNFRGGGGSLTELFFSGGLGKIGKLFINNSFSVEQAISYFTVIYRCFKTSIIVCIDHLLTTVG